MSQSRGAFSRRDLLRLAATAVGAGAVAGCGIGRSGDGNGAGNSGNGGDSTSRHGSGGGKVKALFMRQAAYSENDVRSMTAEFHKVNPEIRVEPTFVDYDALHDKIVGAAPTGGYDVVLIDVIWTAEFSSRNLIVEASGGAPGAWQEGMLGGALSTARYQGRFYAMPWILDTKYLFANAEMLAKAGVDQARLATWDGVLAAAQALKDRKVIEYPLLWSWQQSEALICDYTQLVGAFGGKFLSGDGRSALFNTGGGLAALEFMKKTVDRGLTNPDSLESTEDDVRAEFSAGGAAMAVNWTYMSSAASDAATSAVAGKVAVLPTPTGPAGGPGVNGSMALSVTAGSQNRDAAWDYVRYLTSAEVQNRYAKNSLPCWSASYDDAGVIAANPKVVPVARKQLSRLIERPQVPRYYELSQILQVEVRNALLGRKSPRQALDDAAARTTSLLA